MTENRSPSSRKLSRAQTVRELAERLEQMETARRGGQGGAVAAAGIPALDGLLPEGGFRRGTLVEWLAGSAASGVDGLALLSARGLLRRGTVLVVLDREQTFYPPAAAAWGVPLPQMIVVRPGNLAEEWWAREQCLQSAGVAVSLCRLKRATNRALRRLQLAAERGNGLGFLLRSLSARGQPAWSDVRLAVSSLASFSPGRRWRVELVHSRRGAGGKSVILELDDATGALSPITELAAPARVSRAARA